MTASTDKDEKQGDAGIGCVWTILGVNTVCMGLVALTFGTGPYYSAEQELWYRYGSLAFFFCGSLLPAIALFVWRKAIGLGVITAAITWLLVVLLAFAGFVLMSGGGI